MKRSFQEQSNRNQGRSLFDLLRDNRDNYFMMYTNGTLITRDVAGQMASLGNISPAISVEGRQEQIDTRRGKSIMSKRFSMRPEDER